MKNIILIGMPACGKSSVGVILAKTAAMSFVDTDLLLQEKEGRKLQYIIDDQGMDEFLKIEERILSSVNAENAVISTGGSAVYSEGAMAHLQERRYGSVSEIIAFGDRPPSEKYQDPGHCYGSGGDAGGSV